MQKETEIHRRAKSERDEAIHGLVGAAGGERSNGDSLSAGVPRGEDEIHRADASAADQTGTEDIASHPWIEPVSKNRRHRAATAVKA